MRFKTAVEQTKCIADVYRAGLQAISKVDKRRVSVNDTASLGGSINLDKALCKTYPHTPRWDYGVGWRVSQKRDSVIWIEVHPANTGNVKGVVAKANWLRQWLRDEAPHLNDLTEHKPVFVWIASGAVRIPRHSPQNRQLAGSGVRYPCTHLTIDTC